MQAKLRVVQGRAGRREVVLTLPASIGRRAHQTLQILHPTVSREHCELFEQDGQILVRDKQSANGTWIGGERITESLLRPGDRLTVGPLVFEAEYLPGNGAGTAAPAKKSSGPRAKSAPSASKPAAESAPQAAPEDDLEAAFAAELLNEFGGATVEAADAASLPTLDGEELPAGDADDLGADLDIELLDDLEVGDAAGVAESVGDELADADLASAEIDSADLEFEADADLSAELDAELSAGLSSEVDEAAAGDLDLDLDRALAEPDFSELEAEAPADAAPSELIAPDEPSAPWDVIVAEPSAEEALDDDREIDLAPGDLALEGVGEVDGLEEIDLVDFQADIAERDALDLESAEENGSATGGLGVDELDLDELNLDSPEIESLSDGLELEDDLALPSAEILPDDEATEPGAAAPESLDDFFANLQGGDAPASDDMPAIELDELNLDADVAEIEFDVAAADDSEPAVSFEPGGESDEGALELGSGPELSDDLDQDLELDDGMSELGMTDETARPGEGVELAGFDDDPMSSDSGLRIADLDLEASNGDEVAPVSDLLSSDDAGELELDLESSLELTSAEPTLEAESDSAVEELHLFSEDEPQLSLEPDELALDEAVELSLDEPVDLSLDAPSAVVVDESELHDAQIADEATDEPIDVVSSAEPPEPSTSAEAAAAGTIFSSDLESPEAASEIPLDGDSQELWTVDETASVSEATSAADADLDDFLTGPAADEPPAAKLDETGPSAVEPLDQLEDAAATEFPTTIPKTPDDVDPFDLLGMDGSSAAAAEIIEPFVDDEDTPYDPDSPRQRWQAISPEAAAPPGELLTPATSEDSLPQASEESAEVDDEAPLELEEPELAPADELVADNDMPLVDSTDEVPLSFAEPELASIEAVESESDAEELISFDELEPVAEAGAGEELIAFDEPAESADLDVEDKLDDFLADLNAAPAAAEAESSLDETGDDMPLAFDEPEVVDDDLLAELSDSSATDETVDANAESLLTFDETSVEELALRDAGEEDGEADISAKDDEPLALSSPDEMPLVDDESPAGELALDDLALNDAELGDLGLGETGEDAQLAEALESPADLAADLDLPEAPTDDTQAASAEKETDPFDFLGGGAGDAAGMLGATAAGAAGELSSAPLITPPPGAGADKSERMWWPFGDKNKRAGDTADSQATASGPSTDLTNGPASTPEASDVSETPPPLEVGDSQGSLDDSLDPGQSSAVDEFSLDDLTFDEAPVDEASVDVDEEPVGAVQADDAPVEELAFNEAPLDELTLDEAPAEELLPTDDLPADDAPSAELTFDEAPPGDLPLESPASDLALDDLALDAPLDVGDDDSASAVAELDLPSGPDTGEESIAFLDESAAAATTDSTVDALELGDAPTPAGPAGDLAGKSSATPPAARKWWKFWDKSGKPTKAAKPPKPAKSKPDKKAKGTAPAEPASEQASGATDDLLIAGAAAAAIEPALDFEPLDLGGETPPAGGPA
ncbi:MAG: FHA domain-containing protein, partial [Pirellulales bacterium]